MDEVGEEEKIIDVEEVVQSLVPVAVEGPSEVALRSAAVVVAVVSLAGQCRGVSALTH